MNITLTTTTLMKYDAQTGDLSCFTPCGDHVLELTGVSIDDSHKINNAIQCAYAKGEAVRELRKSLEGGE